MRRWTAFILAVAAVGLAGCTSSSESSIPTPTAQPEPAPTSVSLACPNGIGTRLRGRDVRPVLGVVALPVSPEAAALGTGRLGDPELPRLFAKAALLVRTGSSFRLEAAPDSPSSWAFSWTPHDQGDVSLTRSLVVDHCRASASSRWLAFIGGYYIDHPSCVFLVVRTATHTRRVKIGLGAACPGQSPPVGRSQK